MIAGTQFLFMRAKRGGNMQRDSSSAKPTFGEVGWTDVSSFGFKARRRRIRWGLVRNCRMRTEERALPPNKSPLKTQN